MAWRAARLLVGTDVNRPALFEFRKSITGDEHFNRTGATWYARDQPALLQGEDHVVHRGWCHAEVVLRVCFCWRPPVQLRVRRDERAVLSLERCERLLHGRSYLSSHFGEQ